MEKRIPPDGNLRTSAITTAWDRRERIFASVRAFFSDRRITLGTITLGGDAAGDGTDYRSGARTAGDCEDVSDDFAGDRAD